MEKKYSKRLVSVEEAASFLGISARTIYNGTGARAIRKFPIKPVRVGKSLRFDLHTLERFVESGGQT